MERRLTWIYLPWSKKILPSRLACYQEFTYGLNMTVILYVNLLNFFIPSGKAAFLNTYS